MLANREKDKERFYLLPGMGGRAYRRKYYLTLKVSIAVGLLVSGALAWAIYFLNHPHLRR